MTEAEWLGCEEPRPLLEFLRGRASDRKLRLFAVECAWKLFSQWPDCDHLRVLDAFTAYLDGVLSVEGWLDVYSPANRTGLPPSIDFLFRQDPVRAAIQVTDELSSRAGGRAVDWFSFPRLKKAEKAEQSSLLRDSFGPLPFRKIAFDPACQTIHVVELARAIYDERAFDRLPILWDALLDAGCDNPDILQHCHSEGPHVRGCWVIDLILGKQ